MLERFPFHQRAQFMATFQRPLLTIAAVLLAIAALSFRAVPAWSVEPGDAAIASKCFECHGKEGKDSEDGEPILAGQPELYIIRSLEAFKTEERPGSGMKRIAKKLTAADREAMARYFSALPGNSDPGPFDASLVGKGARLHERFCEECHTDGGRRFRMPNAAGPVLAGQTVEYLQEQFTQFMTMSREMPTEMGIAMLELRPGDSLALAHYYASLAGRP